VWSSGGYRGVAMVSAETPSERATELQVFQVIQAQCVRLEELLQAKFNLLSFVIVKQ